jgi:hypothetical protein
MLRKGSRIGIAVWARLPAIIKFALLAKYGNRAPERMTLGDLRGS